MPTNSWRPFIQAESAQPYYQELQQFLKQESDSGKVIYPPQENVFNAFKLTALENVKVVISDKILITGRIKLTVYASQ